MPGSAVGRHVAAASSRIGDVRVRGSQVEVGHVYP